MKMAGTQFLDCGRKDRRNKFRVLFHRDKSGFSRIMFELRRDVVRLLSRPPKQV